MEERVIPVDYIRKTLLIKLREVLGCRIPDVTFWTWVKKGYVFPSAYITRGKRLMPVFYHSDLDKIVAKLQKLDQKGLIRLKNDKT